MTTRPRHAPGILAFAMLAGLSAVGGYGFQAGHRTGPRSEPSPEEDNRRQQHEAETIAAAEAKRARKAARRLR